MIEIIIGILPQGVVKHYPQKERITKYQSTYVYIQADVFVARVHHSTRLSFITFIFVFFFSFSNRFCMAYVAPLCKTGHVHGETLI